MRALPWLQEEHTPPIPTTTEKQNKTKNMALTKLSHHSLSLSRNQVFSPQLSASQQKWESSRSLKLQPVTRVPVSWPHRSLLIEDRIFLLKGAAIEICEMALNTTFCLQTQNFLCGPLRYTMEGGALDERPEQQEARVLAVWHVAR